jgi:hypothetical protein
MYDEDEDEKKWEKEDEEMKRFFFCHFGP